MNKILFYILFSFTMASFAQERPYREKIKSLKVAFITERLGLTSKEAQIFWPVYNVHEEQMETFRRERQEIREPLRNITTLSDKQADDLVDRFIALEKEKQKELESFIAEIKKIISSKKTILLMKAEDDFKRRLIKQYRNNRRVPR
ncbi:hypothetical protein [Maribacter sp. 2304DJ31-5]|uniref:hypothetical protein n=1 Tax=Maribacter sp. 2304DJ31-5 TaxID=3386273 RepID=UPI0039BC7047